MADEIKDKPASVGRINRRTSFPENLDSRSKEWWQVSRRTMVVGGAAAAGVLLAGGGAWLALRDDSTEVDSDALALQQSQGWNVGSEAKPLNLPFPQKIDSRQSAEWRSYLNPAEMLDAYDVNAQAWMPYFVPTLIQSLQYDSLRNQLTPIYTPDMAEAYGRGQAIARDFLQNAQNPGETALIVDLPGRDSIAFGAGLADAARLIPTFDNYPHPLGVTKSHETLAAMLTYAGEVEVKQATLPENAPPAFLLDSNRLADYKDENAQFDNRYLAKLPSAEKLRERGIKSIFYLTPDRTRTVELDDLNEDFVEYKQSGLNVAMLPLSDFTQEQGAAAAANTNERRYHYGGNPFFLPFFFYSYPFYAPRPDYARRFPPTGAGRTGTAIPTPAPPRYTPVRRPTLFSGTRIGNTARGVGRSKPSGFGRATVRVNSTGRVVGTRAGRSGFYAPGRSGSFGRGGGYGG